VLVHRRGLAALLAGVAVLVGLRVSAGPPPRTVDVPVAARDLAAGATVAATDMTTARLDPALVPHGVVHDPTGVTLAGPLRAGEPITDVRVAGASLAAAHPGLVALPLRLPDAGVVGLLRAGDRVDLVATDPAAGSSSVLVTDALVLAVPAAAAASEGAGGGLTGRLVVLGVPPHLVADTSAAAVTLFLSVAFSR
jgi:Flp pilus assembly protein CpaB